jgi:Tol biopolymer transport system component
MIEISHKQARHLIREARDRRLPEEQWAALYAHLESCPECSAYREHLSSYEKNLHRLLNNRWGAARGPGGKIAERVIHFRALRKKISRIAGRGGLYLLGILLVVSFLVYRDATAPKEPPPSPTQESGFGPFETATPSPIQNAFSQVVAFESRQDGNAEIYLLNGSPDGVQTTNLTHNPAQDTQPAWSPDGQWIAFLSDRSGKTEVYIIHVAGSRLTQVTNMPQIDWSGPLAWSYDGKWLGLTGRRSGLNGASYLYLVPLDGKNPPSSIAYTYLAERWMRFSPGQTALAYLSVRHPGGIDVVNTDTGWTAPVTLEENQSLGLVTGQGGAFDWSLGGRSLVYLAQPGEASPPDVESQQAVNGGSQIRISPEISVSTILVPTETAMSVSESLPSAKRMRAVSWVPNSLIIASMVMADAGGDSQNDCWVIRLINSQNPDQTPRLLPELCVTGRLEQSNWSPDGKWLVVIGRKPSETNSAYYALRLPEFTGRENTTRGDSLLTGSTYIERLADLPAADLPPEENAQLGEGEFFAEPRVRPGGQLKEFVPIAAPSPEPTPDPLAPPPQTRGWLAYSVQKGTDSWIVRSRPDGRSNFALTSSTGEHTCPRIAPDGSRVAYLSDEGSSRKGVNEVFVTGLDRKNTLQLTRGAFPVEERADTPASWLPRYECPVWSPDSKSLAAVHRVPGHVYLAVIPVNGQTPARYFEIELVSDYAEPAWVPTDPGNPTAGSGQILLIYKRTSRPTRLVSIDLNQSENLALAKAEVKVQFYNYDDVQHMAVSSDGKRLAVWLYRQNAVGYVSQLGKASAKLEVIDMLTLRTISDIEVSNYDPDTTRLAGLAWLTDGKIGLVRVDSLLGPRKTLFERFDPDAGQAQAKFETLADFEEVAYRADWIEGRWVAFSSESGFWVLDLEEAQAGHASPAMLSGEVVTEFDWQ